MSKKFTELRFEEWIEKSLLDNGYTHSFTHSGENEGRYDKDLCLVEEDVIGFIKDTQLEEYEKLQDRKLTVDLGPTAVWLNSGILVKKRGSDMLGIALEVRSRYSTVLFGDQEVNIRSLALRPADWD